MKKRVLFIDRDGTLIQEPPFDFQVDSLEKLEFCPEVFTALLRIRKKTAYEFVIVSNQDGLGTELFPMEDFLLPHEKMLTILKSQGIEFSDILIDDSLPEDNSPNRKPATGMLGKYIKGDYDLENSYVIGDRVTDIQLAKNLGAKAIFYNNKDISSEIINGGLSETCVLETISWETIADFLCLKPRKSLVQRSTGETDIRIELDLDGTGKSKINTGLKFFDHMLEQIPRHGNFDLSIQCKGDLEVDEHHTIEDVALALGQAFSEALGDKRGIARYGFLLPMDDSLARVAIDFGGRPWLIWKAEFNREMVGDVPTEMFFHFFKSFSDSARANLNIMVEGDNEHHKIEGIFKAFAKAAGMAAAVVNEEGSLPSTKGIL